MFLQSLYHYDLAHFHFGGDYSTGSLNAFQIQMIMEISLASYISYASHILEKLCSFKVCYHDGRPCYHFGLNHSTGSPMFTMIVGEVVLAFLTARNNDRNFSYAFITSQSLTW